LQNYEYGSSQYSSQRFVGEVIGAVGDKLEIEVKNNFKVGQTVELLSPNGNHRFVLERIENEDGGAMSEAPGSGYTLRIPAPEDFNAEYGLLVVDI
jgi:putative protease